MNRLRFHILSLLIILGAMLQAAAQDVMVTVNPVQPTLPPQAMLYVANPGNYFNVSLINSSGETQNVYLVMDLEQINPNSGLYVKIPAQYQPDKPITVPSGGTHILSMVEMKNLFNHVPNDRIATTPGLFSDYEGGAFGLLPEGQYRMRLVAYRWEPGRDTPVMVSSPSSGQCIFTICYKAQAPEFLMPMPGIGSSSDASVCTMDKQNALFTWKEPIVTCNPGAARFTYKFKVVQLVGGQTPDEAIEYNPAVYEKSGLMSPMLILPQERIRSMIDNMTYVARVTAEQSGLGSNYLNYSMVENDGNSDLRLFRFEPDATTVVTPPTPDNKDKEDKKDEEEDDDEFDFGFGSGKEEVTDSVYNFRNPQIIRPSFPGNAGARKSFTGDDIGVEWKKAWFVGGVGERQDTVKINYEVQLFRGEPEMDRADIFASEPVYTHSTYDLSDSIKWEKISDKVVAGDYMVLRVLPKSENVQSVAFVNDSVNVIDFALAQRISQKFFQCSSMVNIENLKPTKKSAKDFIGKVVGIGQYQLTIDEMKENGKDGGFRGNGRVEWSPLGLSLMVKVEFDSLFINTDDIVYAGKAKGMKGDTWVSNNGEQVDKLFSDWGIDNLIGDTGIPYAKMLQKEASNRGRDIAKQLSLGKYYDYYHRAKDFLTEGKLDNIMMPMKLPKSVNKTPVDIQIVNVTFAPSWASMDLIGTFTLPESRYTDNNILILGAPHTCISPDRLLPESGSMCLLSTIDVKEPSSGFQIKFKAPTDITVADEGQAPADGCYINWQADSLAALHVDIDIAIPKLKKVANGTATDERPVLNIQTDIKDWNNWTASAAMDDFEAEALPGWTFCPGAIVYDHSTTVNDNNMGSFPAGYDKSKADIRTNDKEWMGLYISKVGVKFPKAMEVGKEDGDGDRRLTLAAKDMFFDKSGVSLKFGAEDVISAKTGKLGGWAFTLDNVGVEFLQSNFEKAYFDGNMKLPLVNSDIAYTCNIYNQKRFKKDNDNGYAYIFKVQQVEDINFDFILAEANLEQKQTYFFLEAEDQADGSTKTRLEFSMGGSITIGYADEIQGKLDEVNNKIDKAKERSSFVKNALDGLPLKLSIPGIHFTKMRIANCSMWESIYDKEETQKKAHAAQAEELRRSAWKTLCEEKERNLGSEDKPIYFNMGEWSLASLEKKIGPFCFGITRYDLGYSGGAMTLDLEGKIGLLEDLVVAKAGIQLQAEVKNLDDISNISLEYKDCLFNSIEVSSNLPGITISGRMDVIRPNDKVKDKGYKGHLKFALPGNLFTFDSNGGYFEHKEEGNNFTWGYFNIAIGSAVGLQIPPIELNDIHGGFYFNCRKDPKDATKAIAQKGVIGVTAGLGIAASGGDNVIGGKFSLTVVYDKEHKRLTTFMLDGNVSAMAGLVNSRASIVYQNDDQSKYLRLNVTVDAKADGLAKKYAGEITKYTEQLADSKILKQMQALNDTIKTTYDKLGSMAGLDNLHQEHSTEEKHESKDENKSEQKDNFKATSGAKISLDFGLTWRDKGVNFDKVKWHLYLGKPQKSERCQFILIDLEAKIVEVKIGADAYFCVGNELPDNGALPPIPENIRQFLTGSRGSNGVQSADVSKAERAREEAIREFRANATGGVMLGASVWGYINVDLGILYADMGAEAGFDVSITHIGDEVYCVGVPGAAGWKGWYGEGQLYAYLYAKMGLRLNLGFWNGSIDLVDAGIGGVLQMGLPNPSYFTGDLRMKLRLLGGLINFNRRFQFTCGKKCDIFYGNALDDFQLWGESSIGEETRKNGWNHKMTISPDLPTDFTITPMARLNEQYPLLDQTDLHRQMKQVEAEREILETTSTRTFRFNPSTSQVKLYEYSDSTMRDSVIRYYNIEFNATKVTVRGMRSLNPNRFYKLEITGLAKELRAGNWHDPETYNVKKGKYEEVPWEQTKAFYFRTGNSDGMNIQDGGDLQSLVAVAYPSKYNELKSAEPVIAYATDVQNPLIVLKEKNVLNRLYSDGKLKWKLKKDGKVIEEQEVYAGWENRASASFNTKVLPGNTYNLVLDYEKTKVNKEKVLTEKTISFREKYYSKYTNGGSPNGIAPKTIGGYQVIKIISSRRYQVPAIKDIGTLNMNNTVVKDKISKDLRFGPSFHGPAMDPNENAAFYADAMSPQTRKTRVTKSSGITKASSGTTSSSGNTSSSDTPPTRRKPTTQTSPSTNLGTPTRRPGGTLSGGIKKEPDNNDALQSGVSDEKTMSPGIILPGKTEDKAAEGMEWMWEYVFTCYDNRETEEPVVAANIMDLNVTTIDGDWTTGNNGRPLDYELPFIGTKVGMIQYDGSDLSNIPDVEIGYKTSLMERQKKYPNTNTLLAYYDPFYYISYLANWALIGGWNIESDRIQTMVTTTTSLTYSDLGGNYSGFLAEGDVNYNIVNDWDKIRRNSVYPSGGYGSEYPLPLIDNDRYDYVNPIRSHATIPEYNPKNPAGDILTSIANVYYLAEDVDKKIKENAKVVLDKGGTTFNTKRANAVEEWNLQHLGTDIIVSREGLNEITQMIKIPYYQMTLLWCGIIDNSDSGRKVSLNSIMKGAGKRATPRQSKSQSRMVLFTFTGDNGYPEASFKAKEAMKNLKKMIVRTYRIDDYDVQKKEYTVLHNNSQRDITINEPLKKFY
ncbi:hypothetical protein [uncultured Prevotella sp.]|uniref:hypothetical protein n=1 Tax=uncultured Prevotella sp. TaxID=159272 RepID=UPI0026DB829D|nr:hypothetical protein [uncultured Prevotella sp.]